MLPACPFPSIHWMSLALYENTTMLCIHEYYIKQTYRNRYAILTANGPISLTIPVAGQKGQKIMTKDLRIADHLWAKNHLAALKSAYSRSAFYEFFEDEIAPIYAAKHSFLVDFNLATLSWISRYLPQLKYETSTEFLPFSSYSRADQQTMSAFEPGAIWPQTPAYPQVFADRFVFQPNLSTLDLLMNMGPRAADYILFTKNREQAIK